MNYKAEIEAKAREVTKKLEEREGKGYVPPDDFLPKHGPLRTSAPKKPRKPDTRGNRPERRNGPLTRGQFAPRPYVLDDLIVRLYKLSPGAGRAMDAVVADLTRHTNGEHHDVLVSDQGIATRRRISRSSATAALRSLRDMNFLRRCEPTPRRAAELAAVLNKGFSARRRYLVWTDPEQWKLPKSDAEFRQVVETWERYTGAKKEKRPQFEVVQ